MALQEYKTLPKTQIPTSGEDLCAAEVGSSHLIEILNEACTCGRPLGTIEFNLAVVVANRPAPKTSTEAVCDYMDHYKFQICCRNQVISPLVQAIVNADIGARYISRDAAPFLPCETETSNAPPTITSAIGLPPCLLMNKRLGSSGT